MFKRPSFAFLLSGLVFVFAPPCAYADLVTHTISGIVIDNAQAPGINIGDEFEYSYTYESTTPDQLAALPSVGIYIGAVTSNRLDVGNGTYVVTDFLLANSQISIELVDLVGTGDRVRQELHDGTGFFKVFLESTNTSLFATDQLVAISPSLPPASDFDLFRFLELSLPDIGILINGQVLQTSSTVEISIKPDSDPNSINLKSNGVITVAIVSDGDFDAVAEIRPENVDGIVFGPGEATPAHSPAGHVGDVDGDGDLDVVLHYRTQETGISSEDEEACLSGLSFSGNAIFGCDSIRITPGGSRGGGKNK